jgi:hypothetical protein
MWMELFFPEFQTTFVKFSLPVKETHCYGIVWQVRWKCRETVKSVPWLLVDIEVLPDTSHAWQRIKERPVVWTLLKVIIMSSYYR